MMGKDLCVKHPFLYACEGPNRRSFDNFLKAGRKWHYRPVKVWIVYVIRMVLIGSACRRGHDRKKPTMSSHLINFQTSQKRFRVSILDVPPEMLVEIATRLGTTKNLANFKMTCTRIYNIVESAEKVKRERLPHLKISEIDFVYEKAGLITVGYRQKHERISSYKAREWKYSIRPSTKLTILTRHWILEADCELVFGGNSILDIELLKSLLEFNFGNEIQCGFRGGFWGSLSAPKVPEALPFIRKLLEKVGCWNDLFCCWKLFLPHETELIAKLRKSIVNKSVLTKWAVKECRFMQQHWFCGTKLSFQYELSRFIDCTLYICIFLNPLLLQTDKSLKFSTRMKPPVRLHERATFWET